MRRVYTTASPFDERLNLKRLDRTDGTQRHERNFLKALSGKLLTNTCVMDVERLRGNLKPLGDYLVADADRHQPGHVFLLPGERLVSGAARIDELLANLDAECPHI